MEDLHKKKEDWQKISKITPTIIPSLFFSVSGGGKVGGISIQGNLIIFSLPL